MRLIGMLAVLLAALMLVGVGCGGDDDASGDTTTTETTTDTTDTTTDTTETDTTDETTETGSALKGSVGPGFSIILTTEDGDAVETLSSGSYELEIEDLSSEHNFHLSGPGVDISTDVAETGTQNVPLQLSAGRYEYVCDPHAVTMSGFFDVT